VNGRAVLSLLCLAPLGVFIAAPVTLGAVGSYPTISTLPVPLRAIGGVFSAALSIRLSLDSRSLLSQGKLLYGVRTFLNQNSRPDCDRPGDGKEVNAEN
jgi:hypothetical protein